jgi:glutamate 5-kinase
MAALIDNILPAPSSEKPDRTLAELPVFRSALLQEDAGGEVNRLYDKIEKFTRYDATFKKLIETDPAEAQKYAQDNATEIGKGAVAGKMKAAIDKFNALENIIRNNGGMDGATKQKALENIKKLKSNLATSFSAALAA